jgi:hypothetical protein
MEGGRETFELVEDESVPLSDAPLAEPFFAGHRISACTFVRFRMFRRKK